MGEQSLLSPPLRGNILVVDDNPDNLRLLSQILAERGHKVRAVLSGARALAAVQSTLPDLILLDVLMPEMNGYQLCQQLKADEQTRDIPVIFISALDAIEDKIRAFSVGGVDYVNKPFQADEVLARVETHLALRELQKQLQRANLELARQVQELHELNLKLQSQNAELDAFAHTVAHDLKNPVHLVMGYADLLRPYAPAMDDTGRQAVRGVVQASYKMDSIIEALMLLAGVRKREHVPLEPLDMARIVRDAQVRVTDLIEEYHAEVITPKRWPLIASFGPWVEEVWANYLSNAIKYGGRPPKVTLGATVQSDGQVRFWVRDNGAGLTPQEQAQLFTPFERLDQARVSGHGLGLSIVRRIVEKLGGQVGVESKTGKGSLFFFTLPRGLDY